MIRILTLRIFKLRNYNCKLLIYTSSGMNEVFQKQKKKKKKKKKKKTFILNLTRILTVPLQKICPLASTTVGPNGLFKIYIFF